MYVHQITLTDKNGSVTLYTVNDIGASSLLELNPSALANGKWRYPVNRQRFVQTEPITVVGKTMDRFLKDARIFGNITLVNIAVQGYAGQVLGGIRKRATWESIKEIILNYIRLFVT